MTTTAQVSATEIEQQRDQFVERFLQSAAGAFNIFTIYLGDRLGLYRPLAEHGPLTSTELAEHTGILRGYASEVRFTRFKVLPVDNFFFRLYQLNA